MKTYVYRPRSTFDWQVRATQKRDSFFVPQPASREENDNMSLIPAAELQRARERYLAEHPPQHVKSLAEILSEIVAEFPDVSIVELSEASGRSQRWVRKHLRSAGIEPPKSPRKVKPRKLSNAKLAAQIDQDLRMRS